MQILLTGASGFLGSNLLPHLLEAGHEVVVLKRSTTNLQRLDGLATKPITYDADRTPLPEVFGTHRFDQIIHCATNYGRRDESPPEIIEANLILPLRLLDLAAEHDVRAFLNTDTILDKRVSHYSLSKRQFVEWMQAYSSAVVCVNVALEHFYGPHDDPTKFVTKITHALLSNVEQLDLTAGLQKRDFIFIDDVVAAFLAIAKFSGSAAKGAYRFEVGSGQSIGIREFVETIQRMTGNRKTKLNFGALPYRENEVMESKVDLTRLAALGWKAETSLAAGLERTIAAERVQLKV